jgi:hypothetical protein
MPVLTPCIGRRCVPQLAQGCRPDLDTTGVSCPNRSAPSPRATTAPPPLWRSHCAGSARGCSSLPDACCSSRASVWVRVSRDARSSSDASVCEVLYDRTGIAHSATSWTNSREPSCGSQRRTRSRSRRAHRRHTPSRRRARTADRRGRRLADGLGIAASTLTSASHAARPSQASLTAAPAHSRRPAAVAFSLRRPRLSVRAAP